MASKSKIHVVGGTGYIGKFIVEASAKHTPLFEMPPFPILPSLPLLIISRTWEDFCLRNLGNDVDRVHAVVHAVELWRLQGFLIPIIRDINGDHTNFDIEASFGVEATNLYPNVKYTTVDEFLNQFV
ncbi:hypothetical protein SDJN02_26497, partial [Cucurbita argyrosperma subsp. argyrosperma]